MSLTSAAQRCIFSPASLLELYGGNALAHQLHLTFVRRTLLIRARLLSAQVPGASFVDWHGTVCADHFCAKRAAASGDARWAGAMESLDNLNSLLVPSEGYESLRTWLACRVTVACVR